MQATMQIHAFCSLPRKSWPMARLPRRAARARTGVSLLEVLISIGVILIGLLGVIALIPIGHRAMVQATKADRAAACGRAALREVQVRRMLDAPRWRWGATQLPWYPLAGSLPRVVEQVAPPDPDIEPTLLDNRVSYCIDPLYIARNSQGAGASFQVAGDVRKFPYAAADSDPDWLPFFDPASGDQIWMPRVTILPPHTGINATVHQTLFDCMFTWQDDKIFSVSNDREERPQGFAGLAGLQFNGNYTWMATVVPIPGAPDFWRDIQRTNLLNLPVFVAAEKRLYEVSIVVFYKRDFASPADADFEKPSERIAVASVLGGGEVQLTVAPDVPPSYLDVKKGDWLMLCGLEPPLPPSPPTRNIHKWYRVVAVDEAVERSDPTDPSSRWSRFVTLAGPDWDLNWCLDLDGDTFRDDAQAVLVNNVAGVYTEIMELDRPQ